MQEEDNTSGTENSEGIIYVLTNEAMPELIKIGKTKQTIQARLKDVNSHEGVPMPFECTFAAKVSNVGIIEKKIHEVFSAYRSNPRREFFRRLDPEKVVRALSIGSYEDVTPQTSDIDPVEKEEIEKAKANNSNILMGPLGISPGEHLEFSRDPSFTATVLDDRRVEFEGQEMSLTKAAQEALSRLGNYSLSIGGPRYWMYEEETLSARRKRLEDEQFG